MVFAGKAGGPCLISFRSGLRVVSEAVLHSTRDTISVDSTRSEMLDTPREVLFSELDGEGCLDVASVAWLVLPSRCLM